MQKNKKLVPKMSYYYCLLSMSLLLIRHLPSSHAILENCENVGNTPGEITLTCHLRTINSEFDKVNLSTIASSFSDSGDPIVGLSLLCSDVLFYQSTLPSDSLIHFTKLQTLTIEHCKLSRIESGLFDGLNLKNLTINTHNTAWPTLSLDLSQGIFNKVSSIERIDLSQNNIWTFPDQIFCAVSSLRYLNVSMNRLQDIGDLGFRDKDEQESSKCKMNIEILDVAYNRLILLPPSGLVKLTSLKELYLQGNEISVVGIRALRKLHSLRILDLADNKLTSLPDDTFHDCRDIQEIYLQNNSLLGLAPSLFSKLNQLVILDLSRNRLKSLRNDSLSEYEEGYHPGLFSSLIRLVLLNLGRNQLTKLDPGSFQNLYSLQVLNLEHNQLRAIKPNTFSSMNNLHTLILSHNLLTSIDATSLNGLFVLSQLSIDNNKINSIHYAAFRNCSSLKDLNLNGNNLANVDEAIQDLTLLKTIDLGENQLRSPPRLTGLPNLYGLRLTGNRISNVSKDAFRDLQTLKILNLARNQLKIIEEGAFDSNPNLQALRLDANHLKEISNLFALSPNLIWLNVSDNQLKWFDYALIPKQLQWIDIHKNSISELGNYLQIKDLKLQTLDASFNRISHLGASNLPDSLEMIFLNDNMIKTIEPQTFYKKQNLSRVDIFANQIETLELTSLRLGQIPGDKQVPEMYLAGNPIICDCNSEWLQRINSLDLRQHFKIVDLDSVYCRIVNQHVVLPLNEVKSSQFLCPYTNHCFNLCECCEYNACDCQQQCPQNCDCFNDDVWATNIVDCSSKGHTSMPLHIPMDASQLYLDGNRIDELLSHSLIGRKNLQMLHLNNSGITKIANNSLNGLKRLAVLHLENNYIQRLEGCEFKDLSALRELFLQNNRLQFISNETFRPLIRLEVLKLEHNRLSHFEMWILTENSYLIEINLSYNEWTCECEFLEKATLWVQANVAKLSDAPGVNCRLHGKPFSLVYMNGTRCAELTALSGAIIEGLDFSLPSYMPLLGLIAVICLVLGGLFVVVCRRKRSSSPWTVSKSKYGGGQRDESTNQEEDQEKLYDAYVFCSLKDEGWVKQVLVNELERNDPPYRLCLQHKFPVTDYISEAIIEAVESSKTTILLLSKTFVQNEWCGQEYKSILQSALCGKKIIALTLGQLPLRDLDRDLQILLRSAVVISVSDKTFFSKLKSALPTPRVPYFQNTIRRSGTICDIIPYDHSCDNYQRHQQHLQNNRTPSRNNLSTMSGSSGGNYPTMNKILNGSGFVTNIFSNHEDHTATGSSNSSTMNFTTTNSSVNSSSVLPTIFAPFSTATLNRPLPPVPSTPRRPPPEILSSGHLQMWE